MNVHKMEPSQEQEHSISLSLGGFNFVYISFKSLSKKKQSDTHDLTVNT